MVYKSLSRQKLSIDTQIVHFFCFKVFVFGTFSLKERLISYKIKSKLKLYKIKRVGTCMLLI